MNTTPHSQQAFHRGTASSFAILCTEQSWEQSRGCHLTQLEADESLAKRLSSAIHFDILLTSERTRCVLFSVVPLTIVQTTLDHVYAVLSVNFVFAVVPNAIALLRY